MRILVTGGAGYIGSHMTRKLVELGHEVVVLDSMELGHRGAIPPEAEVVVGDIGDEKVVREITEKKTPEAVIHFAAYAKVGESVKEPEKYFMNNLVKPARMVKILVEAGVNKLIFSSTAAVYGNPTKVPITEDQEKRPTNPYGLAKWCFEQVLDYYDGATCLRSIRLRYFNACGAALDGSNGEDHRPESHIIPKAIEAITKGEEFQLFGTDYPTADGTCVRDYIHIEDLISAHVLALKALEGGHKTDVFNVATGKGYSNRQILETVEQITGKKFKIREAPRRAGDPAELVADSTKLQRELGWKPTNSSLETIIGSAWKWHVGHPDGYAD